MKTLTPLQRKALFMGIRPAAIEVDEDPEVYRKRILKEELGVEHLGEVSRNGGFDKLMSRIWADRGDYERALSYSKGSEVRLVHLIVDAARRSLLRRPTTTATSTSMSLARWRSRRCSSVCRELNRRCSCTRCAMATTRKGS